MTTFSGGMCKLFARALDDAAVGLVRHEPVEIVDGVAGGREDVFDDVGDLADGVPEDLLALHVDEPDGARRGRTAGRC